MTSCPLSRRSFLAASLALAAGPRRSFAADPYGGLRVGVQSYSFRKFSLEQALKRTQELGLGYAEFYRGHVPTDSSPEKLAAIKALCKEYGVTPIAFGVESFTKDAAANKKLFDFAAGLGVKYLSADPTPDSFDSLDKLVDEYKIGIAIHPHGPSGKGRHRWYSAEVILAAVKDHHPLIGTCLDTGHLIRMAQLGQPLDPAQQIRVMGPRNFGLHLKDHDNKRKEDVPYGDPAGVLDVTGVLKALKEVKFDGYISIEYEAHPDDPSPDMRKCVAYLKDAVAKSG
ncbi:MAG: sugar phosphate isomerase/epimerase [Gemmataceae bacterium]